MHLAQLKEQVAIPAGVTASVKDGVLHVKGPKGELSRKLSSKNVTLAVHDGAVAFHAANATRIDKRALRTSKAHAANMLKGAHQGFTYTLKICSGHFPMNVAVKDGKLEVKNFIGEKVPRVLQLMHGCEVKVQGADITVTAASKELAGNQAGAIERLTRRPGFDTRIFQDGIYITKKDDKQV